MNLADLDRREFVKLAGAGAAAAATELGRRAGGPDDRRRRALTRRNATWSCSRWTPRGRPVRATPTRESCAATPNLSPHANARSPASARRDVRYRRACARRRVLGIRRDTGSDEGRGGGGGETRAGIAAGNNRVNPVNSPLARPPGCRMAGGSPRTRSISSPFRLEKAELPSGPTKKPCG